MRRRAQSVWACEFLGVIGSLVVGLWQQQITAGPNRCGTAWTAPNSNVLFVSHSDADWRRVNERRRTHIYALICMPVNKVRFHCNVFALRWAAYLVTYVTVKRKERKKNKQATSREQRMARRTTARFDSSRRRWCTRWRIAWAANCYFDLERHAELITVYLLIAWLVVMRIYACSSAFCFFFFKEHR